MPSVELFHHSSRRWRSTWLTGMFSLLAVLPAPASQIALTFSGAVTGSDTLGINVGDLYSGSLLYDTTDPFYVSNPPFDYYRFGETDMLTITVGSCTLSGFGPGTNSPNLLIVAHDQVFNGGSAGDLFGAVVNGSSNCGLFSPNGLAFEIVGPPGLLLDGGVPSSFDLGKIVQPGYSGYSTDVAATFSNGDPPCQSQNGTCFFQGDFTSMGIATPEPSTGVLLISAFSAVFVARRRLRVIRGF